MLNKKIAFALISFVTLSASSAMAQVESQVGVISQDANTVNTAIDGTAFSNTQQKADQYMYQNDPIYYGGYGSSGYDSQLGVIEQNANTVNTAHDGAAFSDTQQKAEQYLYQGR